MAEPVTRHLKVARTARYFLLGESDIPPRLLIFVLHGYGMHAGAFITRFECLVKPGVLVVAPEGLSRFYRKGFSGDVVASWMTKDDRLTEIEDYVGYLDKLYEHLNPGGAIKTIVLGFSQGVATASRWLCMGNARPAELVLWCGEFAPDAGPLPAEKPLVRHVFASGDEFISPGQFASQSSRLRSLGFELIDYPFEGVHAIDRETLQQVFKDAGT